METSENNARNAGQELYLRRCFFTLACLHFSLSRVSMRSLHRSRSSALGSLHCRKNWAMESNARYDDFWQTVTSQGAPLVESINGDTQKLLVTFLWRAKDETKNVLVSSPLNSAFSTSEDLSPALMTHVAGTDLWYKTYRLRHDLRMTYALTPLDVNIPAGKLSKEFLTKMGSAARVDSFNPQRAPGLPRSLLALPAAPPQPWIKPQSNVAAGQVSTL